MICLLEPQSKNTDRQRARCMPAQGRSPRMCEDNEKLKHVHPDPPTTLESTHYNSDSNDPDSFIRPTTLSAPSDYPHPSSQPDTPVHSELSRSNSLSLQDTWKLQRAETEMKKCLGKDTEVLLKSYSCAWQRDILVHGRMYVTPNWFCFYSNILGWETKTSIKFTDVTSISKQKTALVFPNAILIEVGHKKFGFSSVVYRDKVYHVLVTIWKNTLSTNPLSEAALVTAINDWKHHTKDLPNSVLSTSFTVDSSDQDTDPEQHTRHTLATSTEHTLDSSDSDSNRGIDQTDLFTGRLSSCSEVTTSSAESGTSRSSSSNDSHIDNVPMSHLNKTDSLQLSKPCQTDGKDRPCKQDLSAVGFHKFLRKSPLAIRCSSTVIINMLLVTFIVILLVSTLTMLCRLSHMEPSLQPYLVLQPWCRLCVKSIDETTVLPNSASTLHSHTLDDI